jgi:hypothetical protein
MRKNPIYVALTLCLTGCVATPVLPLSSNASTFTEQRDAAIPAIARPLLPIRAVPRERLPIQAVSLTSTEHIGTGPLAGLITKVASGSGALPIVAVVAKQVWTLTAGHTVGEELQGWGEKAGWKVIWSMPKDWSVPATTSFSGDFKSAASDVVKTLAANGALVRAQFYDGNKTMIVTGPGVVQQ